MLLITGNGYDMSMVCKCCDLFPDSQLKIQVLVLKIKPPTHQINVVERSGTKLHKCTLYVPEKSHLALLQYT